MNGKEYIIEEGNVKEKYNLDSYNKSCLLVQLDGISNTRNGHSQNTTVWEDLSGNNNDFTKFFNAADTRWSENSFKGDGTTNSTLVLNKDILKNATECTIEVCYDVPKLKDYYWVFQNRQNNNPANGFQFTTVATGRGIDASANNSVFNSINNIINITDIGKKTMAFALDSDNITYSDNASFYSEETKEGIVQSIADRTCYAIGSMYPWNPYAGFFEGNIYAIRVYNRKLSEEELRHNYEVDKQRFNM